MTEKESKTKAKEFMERYKKQGFIENNIMHMTDDEFKTKAKEVIDTCEKYGFMENKIMPYGFGITVEEFTRNWKDYDNATRTSRLIMHDELTGFLPILEKWVKVENEPMIKVKCLLGDLAGQIKEYHESTAKELIEIGFAEAVCSV